MKSIRASSRPRLAIWIGLAALLASTLVGAAGQQPNSAGATMRLNGVDNGVYPILVPLAVPGSVTFDLLGAPGMPFLLALGGIGSPGVSFGPVGSLDLDTGAAITLLLNGFGPVVAADFFSFLDGAGGVSGTVPVTLPGQDRAFQAIIADPTNPAGVGFTAASRLVTTAGAATALTFPGEDGSVLVPFANGPFSFWGASYTGVHVNANGNLTFGQADATDVPSAALMSSGPPRVALAWRDLDPTIGGTVTFFEDAAGFTVDFFAVPVRLASGAVATTRLNGLIRVETSGSVLLLIHTTPGGDQITGVSPGNGAAPPIGRNLSLEMPIVATGSEPVFESFSAGSLYDLPGLFLAYTGPDASGAYVFDSVNPIPTVITQTLPASGPFQGLASLVVQGRGFSSQTLVTVGGAPANQIDVLSREELVIITPPGALGFADVHVSDPVGGSDLMTGAYEYLALAPVFATAPLTPGASLQVPFAPGFVFPFFGAFYTELWMNANGTVTFGGPDAAPTPGSTAMNGGLPRIALAWNDWQWPPGAAIAVHFTPYFLTLGFANVLSPDGVTSFSIGAVLSHHGEVFTTYALPTPAGDSVLCGISPGGAISPVTGSLDVSVFTGPTGPFASAFEVFSPANPFDLLGLDWDLQPVTVAAPSFSSSVHP